MKFLFAEIEEFGKLEHRCFTFGDGITLIEGENESGKSTLLAFFRFVLYGFPRRGGVGGDERDKRLSFRNRRAAGSLVFSAGEREYRVFRSVTAKNERETTERLSVTAEPEGSVVELGGKTPGELFLGIPAELYDSSLCVRQSEIDRVGEGDVSGKVGELLAATGGAERAGKLLENARRRLCYRKGRGGRIFELEDEEAALTRGIDEATQAAAALAALSAKEKQEAKALAQCKAELAAEDAATEKARLTGALEQYRELCRAEEEERGAALRVRELEGRLSALPDEETLSRLGILLGRERECRRDFAYADATLRGFEPDLPPAAQVTENDGADGTTLTDAAPFHTGSGLIGDSRENATPAHPASPARSETSAHPASPARRPTSARLPWVFCALFALLALGAALLAKAASGAAPALAPRFDPALLWGAAGGGLLLCIGFGGFALFRRRACRIPRMSEAHLAAREAYSRTLENLLDIQNALYTEWEKACGVRFVPSADPEAVLREYARERGGILSEIAAKKETESRAQRRAAFLRERVGTFHADAVQKRLEALASIPMRQGSAEEISAKRAALNREITEREAGLSALARELAARSATANDPATLSRARAQIREKLVTAREELAALDLAQEALAAAQTELRRNIAPTLCNAAGKIFGQLCQGASGHDGLHLGADFSVMLDAEGDRHPLFCFSAGCRDAAYLSLRMALASLLTEEPAPLLLDEPAARLDDRRAAALLCCLSEIAESGTQCLLFTCHKREAELLADITPFARIAL